MIMDMAGDDELVGLSLIEEASEPGLDLVARAEEGIDQRMIGARSFMRCGETVDIIDRRRQLPRLSAPQPDEGLLQRGEDAARLRIAVGGDDIGGDGDIGLVELE